MLERYRLVDRLGAGGFGVVWRARDEHLEREVAVKAIARIAAAPHGGGDDRPAREARAAARLNHPGIVALYEMGSDDDAVYLVSELVHGRTFAELGRARALSDRDIGRIGVALADALGHAHTRGVIHRDVKPQNVIVLAEPAAGAGFAKLADFGVAHLVGDEPLTRTGDIVGTLAYMAPEQAEGRAPTGACDVYSLALTLYEGLAGQNPVRGRSPAETARLVGQYVPSLRDYRRDLPISLCRGLDACLEPRPGAPAGPRRAARLGRRVGRPARVARRARRAGHARALRAAAPRRAARGAVEDREPAPVHEEPERFEPEPLPRRREAEPPARELYHPAEFEPLPARQAPAPLLGGRFARLLARTAAGMAAGGLALAALAAGDAGSPVAPVSAAAVVALAVALLPRVAWLLVAIIGGPVARPGRRA